MMLKILIIQQIYGHSDPEIELELRGNLELKRKLAQKGFELRAGKIIDARLLNWQG